MTPEQFRQYLDTSGKPADGCVLRVYSGDPECPTHRGVIELTVPRAARESKPDGVISAGNIARYGLTVDRAKCERHTVDIDRNPISVEDQNKLAEEIAEMLAPRVIGWCMAYLLIGALVGYALRRWIIPNHIFPTP